MRPRTYGISSRRLAEHKLHARIALQRAREDDAGQELGTSELEQGEPGRTPLGGVLLGHLLIRGLPHGIASGVERDRDITLLGRGPRSPSRDARSASPRWRRQSRRL